MYQLVKNEITGEINNVRIIDGNKITAIPFDPNNTDYQQYQLWLAAGNTPLPADGE